MRAARFTVLYLARSDTTMPEIPSRLPDGQREIIRSILDAHGYDELTQTQHEAFYGGILNSDNGILIAETGNGKTLVAEASVKQALENDEQVAYLVPSSQLRTAKKNELQQWAEDDGWIIGTGGWGLRNGDVSVCTFEQFYQLIIQDIGNARSVGQVILDDFHEIYSSYRGPNIEKAIAALREANVDILGISATLGNPIELAEWLNDATLIESNETRNIPIEELPIEAQRTPSRKAHLADVVEERVEKAPFLIFNNSKKSTKGRTELIAERDLFPQNDTDHLAEIDAALSTAPTETHEELAALMSQGVAYHHSGLETDVREVVVDAVQAGDIYCLCCTPGLAYGFDAPIQTVIPADLKMFNGSYMEYIGCWEYLQWIGRAGRQGHGFDPGYAIPLWQDWDEAKERFQFDTPTGEKKLEDVKTHLDDETRLRWLFLDLVATRWSTPAEIENFLRHTLYWEQVRTSTSSWSAQYDSPAEELDATLSSISGWLTENEFLTHSSVDDSFSLPELGMAAVEFNRNVWVEYPLPRVHSYYRYLEDKLEPVPLLARLCELFGVSLSKKPDSEAFESKCRSRGLTANDAGMTAGVLAWYWCNGKDLDVIEAELDFDPAGIGRTARELTDLLEAGKYLFDAYPRRDAPVWWDTLAAQLQHGVKAGDLALIDAVRGLGRKRGQALRDGVERYLIENDIDYNGDATLIEVLVTAREHVSDLSRLVKTRTDGVGDVIAERIEETIAGWDEDEHVDIHDPFDNSGDISVDTPDSRMKNASLNRF